MISSLLEFWEIDELLLGKKSIKKTLRFCLRSILYVIDACCAFKFYPKKDECCREIESQVEEDEGIKARHKSEVFGDSCFGRWRKKCWNLTEYPETSFAAKVSTYTQLKVRLIGSHTSGICLLFSVCCHSIHSHICVDNTARVR